MAGGINTYGYVGGNPVGRIDPLGLSPDLLAISDPSTYYEIRADEIGADIFTPEGVNEVGAYVASEALDAFSIMTFMVPTAKLMGLGSCAARTVKNGDYLLKEFKTSKGIVEILAEARVKGNVLKLKDIAVFPKGADRFNIGPKEVLQIKNQLTNFATSQGFKRLRITGTRISGANPGKKVNVKVNLGGGR